MLVKALAEAVGSDTDTAVANDDHAVTAGAHREPATPDEARELLALKGAAQTNIP